MNNEPSNPDNLLAAEFVLGTLDGDARQQFQRRLMRSEGLRQLTRLWEQRLNVLGEGLSPEPPHKKVWQNISLSLGFESRHPRQKAGWQVFASWLLGFVSTASLAAFLYLYTSSPAIHETHYEPVQASVFSQQGKPMWMINVTKDALYVTATEHIPAQSDGDYELWMVFEEGTAPVSLGVLPQSGSLVRIKERGLDWSAIQKLAISLEAPGGSTTGLPAEVKFVADLVGV